MSRWKENILSLALAFLLVLMIRSTVIEAFRIPSGSMIPTLLVGDHIFVNKLAYGLRVPFSDWILEEPIYLIKRDPPKRGDIVVFKYPKSFDETVYFIKRIVGVPGDTVEVRSKRLYINGNEVAREPVTGEEAETWKAPLAASQYDSPNLELFREALGDEKAHILVDRNNFTSANYGPATVPEKSYFVMGDNRDYSNDSRFWGYVPEGNIKGKAFVVFLSFKFGLLSDDGETVFRPLRTGTILR